MVRTWDNNGASMDPSEHFSFCKLNNLQFDPINISMEVECSKNHLLVPMSTDKYAIEYLVGLQPFYLHLMSFN